jgi:hypothetical protein
VIAAVDHARTWPESCARPEATAAKTPTKIIYEIFVALPEPSNVLGPEAVELVIPRVAETIKDLKR